MIDIDNPIQGKSSNVIFLFKLFYISLFKQNWLFHHLIHIPDFECTKHTNSGFGGLTLQPNNYLIKHQSQIHESSRATGK